MDPGGDVGVSEIQTEDVTVTEPSKVGEQGALVIPAKLRRRLVLAEGSEVIAAATPEGILVRPAMPVPIELYSDERKAEFPLSDAADAEDDRQARKGVRRTGLDPFTDTSSEDRPPRWPTVRDAPGAADPPSHYTTAASSCYAACVIGCSQRVPRSLHMPFVGHQTPNSMNRPGLPP